MKSITIIKEEQELLICYAPTIGFESIKASLESGVSVKRTFWISESNLKKCNDDKECFVFRIASTKGKYYCLEKEVFDIHHSIYIEKTLDISETWFFSYPHISIFSILDSMLSNDLYIVEINDGIDNHLPASDYVDLINSFPNSYERDKYSTARIAYFLSNYIEGTWKYIESYERYLKRKDNNLSLGVSQTIKLYGYEMYKKAAEELEAMLNNPLPFSESVWQEKIYEIICVLYPKYIAKFREIEVGSDGRHMKKPDFLLVDTGGFVDLLEIKKPNGQKVVSETEYRNNYVAGRDLEGAIVQIEKYIYILNHEGEDRVCKIRNQISPYIPNGISVKVVNPQGILLLGRSNSLTKEQLYDFEIIKRQHKNIVEIMTYDDLLHRLNNILKQMETDTTKEKTE